MSLFYNLPFIYMKYLSFLILITFSGCLSPVQSFNKIPPGIWRGIFMLDRAPVVTYGDDRDIVKKFDIDGEVPFNFEVVYDNDTIFHIVIHNDTERIKVTDIKFNRDNATAKDTIQINFPVYDTQIKAIYEVTKGIHTTENGEEIEFELVEKLEAAVDALNKKKINHNVTPLENPSEIKVARRDIARMKTELRQRELNK